MAGVRSKPLRSGKYQGWFIDRTGKQRYFVGTSNKTQTRRMAKRLEDEHRQMRYGYKPLPKVEDQHALRPLNSVVVEYIAWDKSQGGRGGRAWSLTHTRKRQRQLDW
ncbi:MAG: hypothetical protein O7G88_16495 [bacterium]|nr:hypothetical protein [bacterium]